MGSPCRQRGPGPGKLSRTHVERSQEGPTENRRWDLCPLPLILAACGKPSGHSLPLRPGAPGALRQSQPCPCGQARALPGEPFPSLGRLSVPEARGSGLPGLRQKQNWDNRRWVGKAPTAPPTKWAYYCLHLSEKKDIPVYAKVHTKP